MTACDPKRTLAKRFSALPVRISIYTGFLIIQNREQSCGHPPGDQTLFTLAHCQRLKLLYRLFMPSNYNQRMDVLAVARALNQKAAQTKLHHFCDPTLAFSDPVYEQFLSLWKSKAGTRAMPAKSEITPRDLKDFLRHVAICQRVAENPSQYVWRFTGTKVAEVTGDHTGKTFEEAVPPEILPRWIECADLVLDGGQPLRFLGRVHLNGHEYLSAENLLVPLANDEGQPTFVMGLCRYTPRLSENEESWETQITSIPGGLL
jgi:hypothetical protein